MTAEQYRRLEAWRSEALQRQAAADEDEVVRIEVSNRQQQARHAEGFGSFVEGAVMGNFSDNNSWSAVAGQTVVGFTPLGVVADVRDLAAAGRNLIEGREGAWTGVAVAGVGFVPGLDFLKAGSRLGREALTEVAQQGVSREAQASLRRLGRSGSVSREGVQQARSELVTLNVARADVMARLDDHLAVGTLHQNARDVVESGRNSLRDHLTQDDLAGALRDVHRRPVRRSGDGYTYNHLREVRESLESLQSARDSLGNELRRYQPGSAEYRRISSDMDAIAETERRMREFLNIR